MNSFVSGAFCSHKLVGLQECPVIYMYSNPFFFQGYRYIGQKSLNWSRWLRLY